MILCSSQNQFPTDDDDSREQFLIFSSFMTEFSTIFMINIYFITVTASGAALVRSLRGIRGLRAAIVDGGALSVHGADVCRCAGNGDGGWWG